MAVFLLNNAVFYFEGGLFMSLTHLDMPIEIILQTVDRFLETGICGLSQYNEFELFQMIQYFKQLRQGLGNSISVKHKVYFIVSNVLCSHLCGDTERKVLEGIQKTDQILDTCYHETIRFGITLQYNRYGKVVNKPNTQISYWLDWWEEYSSTLTELDWAYFILCRKEQKIPINLYPQQSFAEYISCQEALRQKKRTKKFKL